MVLVHILFFVAPIMVLIICFGESTWLAGQYGSIIKNVCYSLIAADIFSFFNILLPFHRKKKYYKNILAPRKTSLNTAYDLLINLLKTKDSDYKIDKSELGKKLSRNGQWDKNLQDVIKRSERFVNEIDNLLKYDDYIEPSIVALLSKVRDHIISPDLNNNVLITDIDERNDVVGKMVDYNFQPLFDEREKLKKFIEEKTVK